MSAPADTGETPRENREAILAAWDDYSASAGFAPTTRAFYHGIATRFLCWLESRSIEVEKVTLWQVECFLDEQHVNPATRSSYRSTLRRLFDALVARGLVPLNPVGDVRAERPLTMDNLPDRFASFTEIERQATVDAASAALLFHDIYLFTEGQGGRRTDVALCEATLQLGEKCGIVAFSWADGDQDLQAAQQPGAAHD
jgi:hypothetical protein